MINKNQRKPHSYKVSDKFYKKAMRRAKKEKTTLAHIVEANVIGYALEFDKDENDNPNK